MALGFGLALTSYRKAAGGGGGGSSTDPYFSSVPLLLNTTSTNGQQNNTFLDSSTNNFTITRNGTPTQGSFTPYQPSGYWSNYFNGTTQYVSVGGTTSLSANFTIEFWFFPSSAANSNFFGIDDTQNPNSLACTYNAGAPSIVVFADAGTPIGGGAPVVLNSWNHVALVRSSSTVTVYVNGIQKATGSVPNSISGSLQIGRWLDSGSYTNGITGYMSNFRVSNTNIYSGSTFTVPTSPLTSSANTLLLTLQDNRVKDNSSSPKTLTVSGSPPVQAFQPFSPAASYSAATYGGSGYFNGSTDWLSAPSNAAFSFGTGDFTIEYWLFPISFSTSPTLVDLRNIDSSPTGYSDYYSTAGKFNIYIPYSTIYTSSATLATNTWTHVAVARQGTTIRVFINGVLDGTVSNSTNFTDTYCGLYRGWGSGGGGNYFNGYGSNLRIVKGTAIYTSSFTPPTTPLTAVSGTSLLTNFANAGIYDAAWQNNALTMGDAQVSTTQKQWGTTSMKFDGTGDWLTALDSPGLQLGSGDFTIEGWVYLSATGVAYGLISKGTASTGWSVNVTSGNKLQFSYTSSNLTGATSLSATTWYYFAVVRSGTAAGNLKVYLNGTADATSGGAVTDNFNQTSTFYIGADRVGGSALNGYLQDIRITKGVARTITTPTAAFPTR